MVQVNLTASTSLHSADEFRNLVIKQVERRRSSASRTSPMSCSAPRTTIRGRLRRQAGGLYRHPGRAGRQSARRHRTACASVFPDIQAQLPHGLNGEIVYDFDRIREQLDRRGGPARLIEALVDRHRRGLSPSSARCARCSSRSSPFRCRWSAPSSSCWRSASRSIC